MSEDNKNNSAIIEIKNFFGNEVPTIATIAAAFNVSADKFTGGPKPEWSGRDENISPRSYSVESDLDTALAMQAQRPDDVLIWPGLSSHDAAVMLDLYNLFEDADRKPPQP